MLRQSDGFVSLNCTASSDDLEHPAGRHPLRSAWRGKKSKAVRTKPGYAQQHAPNLRESVRQREAHVVRVRLAHDHLIQKVAHTARTLRPGEVALSGTPPQQFPGGADLEALCGATMRLQLHFLVLLHDILVAKNFVRLVRRLPVDPAVPERLPPRPFSEPAAPAGCWLPSWARIPPGRGP